MTARVTRERGCEGEDREIVEEGSRDGDLAELWRGGEGAVSNGSAGASCRSGRGRHARAAAAYGGRWTVDAAAATPDARPHA